MHLSSSCDAQNYAYFITHFCLFVHTPTLLLLFFSPDYCELQSVSVQLLSSVQPENCPSQSDMVIIHKQ